MAAKGNRSRAARKAPKAQPLTVEDHAWGCTYTGTREQIIGAGLIGAKAFPKTFPAMYAFEGEIRDQMDSQRKVRVLYKTSDQYTVAVEYGNGDRETNPFRIVMRARAAMDDAIRDLRERMDQAARAVHVSMDSALLALRPVLLSDHLGIVAKNTGSDPAYYADEAE